MTRHGRRLPGPDEELRAAHGPAERALLSSQSLGGHRDGISYGPGKNQWVKDDGVLYQ